MMQTPFFLAAATPAEFLAVTILEWLGLSLLYGTLLAGFTWLLMRTAFRRAGLACAGVVWAVVLLKFIIPTGPGFLISLATLVESTRSAFTTAAPQPVEVAASDEVEFVTLFTHGEKAQIAATVPLAAAPTPAISLPLLLVGLYALCLLAISSMRAHQFIRICRRCAALPRAEPALIDIVDDACRRVGLNRRPDVRLSDSAPAPFVVGVLRPTLVLSHRHLTDHTEAEAVIFHELGHLRPVDLFLRCLQCLVGTLLFFWPVVAWVNRRIDLAREHACDDWALSHGHLSSSEYARCLLRALQPVPSTWAFYQPAAMAANPRHVERRIEMILDHSKHKSHARTLGVGALLAVAAWGVFALAGSAKVNAAIAPADAANQPTETKTKRIVVTRVNDDADGQVDVQVVKLDDGKMKVTVNGKEQIIDVPEDSNATNATAHAMTFVAKGDATMAGPTQFAWSTVDPALEPFLADHPAADLDADGILLPDERDAYLTALAAAAPAQVLAQYPKADLNTDGMLDSIEAARLIGGGMFNLEIAGDTPHVMAFRAREAELPDIEISDIDDPGHAVFVATSDENGNAVQPKAFAVRIKSDVKTAVEGAEDGRKMVVIRATGTAGEDESKTALVEYDVETIDDNAQDASGLHTFCPLEGRQTEKWLLENIAIVPTPTQLADAAEALKEARLAQFLELHPDADASLDGRLTPVEQKTFLDAEMARVRSKILQIHPAADADHDGILTETEMKDYFKSKVMNEMKFTPESGAEGANVLFIGPPTEDQAIEIRLIDEEKAKKDGC